MATDNDTEMGQKTITEFFALLMTEQVMIILMSVGDFDENLNTRLGISLRKTKAKIRELKEKFGNSLTEYEAKRDKYFPGSEAIPRFVRQKQLSLKHPQKTVYTTCLLEVETW